MPRRSGWCGGPLGPGRVRVPGGQDEPQVGVLMGGLDGVRRDVDDGQVPEPGIGPGQQVGQAGLLAGLAQRDGQRVALPRIAVPADLQPGLLALVPAQQHPPRGGMHDQRGPGDVQRSRAQPRVLRGRDERADPLDVGSLGLAPRTVPAEQAEQRAVGSGHREASLLRRGVGTGTSG